MGWCQVKLKYEDEIYKPDIKTVELYPLVDRPMAKLEAPAIPLIQPYPLLLEFDQLTDDADYFMAKIIHCDANWQPSDLYDLDYLYEFNEFRINDYEFSFDTRVNYVHYSLLIPRVKVPGNYLVMVFQEDNPTNLILSKRFFVYDNKVGLNNGRTISGLGSIIRENHQIEFEIDYSKYELVNPFENVTVSVRQNQRWDRIIYDLKPSFVKEDIKILEYRHFNFENNFRAGNEFRFFDLRSVRSFGQNVDYVDIEPDGIYAQLMVEKPRYSQAYGGYDDLNGKYMVENIERADDHIESEYVNIGFNLKAPKLNGTIYVQGAVSDWKLKYPMTYDPGFEGYKTNILLKQGWYNYLYQIESDSLKNDYLEGSHFQTENQYEIFIYYRALGSRTDYLIGYYSFWVNR